MVFEWYSGSDTTGRVASALSAFYRDWREMSQEEIAARLEPLLDLERDPNFRALLFTRIGQARLNQGAIEVAMESFREAERLFDVFAANFRDVLADYRLMLDSLLFQDSSAELALRVNYANAYLASLDFSSGDADCISLVAASMAQDLIQLDGNEAQQTLYRMALAWAMRAHRLAPYEEGHLSLMAHCYSRLGDRAGIARMADALEQLAPNSEQTQIVRFLLAQAQKA